MAVRVRVVERMVTEGEGKETLNWWRQQNSSGESVFLPTTRVVSFQSPGSLENTVSMIIVRVAGLLGLLVSEREAKIMCTILAKGDEAVLLHGQRCLDSALKPNGKEFEHLGGKICKDGSVEDDANHRVQRAHDC